MTCWLPSKTGYDPDFISHLMICFSTCPVSAAMLFALRTCSDVLTVMQQRALQ